MAAPSCMESILRIGSVACGVKIIGVVTEAEKIRFSILNRKTGNKVRSVYVDEETNEQGPADQQIKGTKPTKMTFLWSSRMSSRL